MKQFSTEQLLDRWEDQREIKNLMVRFANCFLLKKEREIFETFWSHEQEDVCLGVNNGYYKGADAVRGFYGGLHEMNLLASRLLKDAFPKELGDKSDGEIYGVGSMDYKPLDTGVIELSGDGRTAKGVWTVRGSHVRITAGGPASYWEWGWFAVDLVREGGEWKIWHMLHLDDICCICGTKWHEPAAEYPPVPEFEEIGNFAMPEPTVKETLRELYHTRRARALSPRVPEPYETFGETFSYGI